jgi:hypothetical protein
MSSKQEILQLLRPAPGYRNASRVADDCAKLLKDRKSLTPKLGIQGNRGIINTFLIWIFLMLSFITSATQSGSLYLLYLDGTIPMIYMNQKYNCPLQIWFTYEYPRLPPTCVVVPVPTMRIHPGHMHVGPDGLVYHPYLSDWREISSLDNLCKELSQVFGNVPPVYSVQTGAAAQPPRPLVAANPTTPATPAQWQPVKDDDPALSRALLESQKEEERHRREIEERERALLASILDLSKTDDDDRRRAEKRRQDEEEQLRRAEEEFQLIERRKRQELIALVSTKLQVTYNNWFPYLDANYRAQYLLSLVVPCTKLE